MYYVYLLQSESHPGQRYIGFTGDLRTRLKTHNGGGSPHTSKYRPWKLVTYLAFSEKTTALAFERYLKSGSGHAFANKRLWSDLFAVRSVTVPSAPSEP
jgi:putative endonuclease